MHARRQQRLTRRGSPANLPRGICDPVQPRFRISRRPRSLGGSARDPAAQLAVVTLSDDAKHVERGRLRGASLACERPFPVIDQRNDRCPNRAPASARRARRQGGLARRAALTARPRYSDLADAREVPAAVGLARLGTFAAVGAATGDSLTRDTDRSASAPPAMTRGRRRPASHQRECECKRR